MYCNIDMKSALCGPLGRIYDEGTQFDVKIELLTVTAHGDGGQNPAFGPQRGDRISITGTNVVVWRGLICGKVHV